MFRTDVLFCGGIFNTDKGFVCFTLCLFIILLVQFELLSGHLLGNGCPLGQQFVLIVFCLFVIFIYFPLWF